ncbi:hypothetical protein B0H16DRAFT_1887473 [Mycena metata]|uniref:Uncharacterized protein n=1 Tax=Mycena metata TaxID=1033252 RepID=A0AAD7IVV6_9AGAR|nr:hypothetical protein B0H16DRAFT_1887473 [Mycena metata]
MPSLRAHPRNLRHAPRHSRCSPLLRAVDADSHIARATTPTRPAFIRCGHTAHLPLSRRTPDQDFPCAPPKHTPSASSYLRAICVSVSSFAYVDARSGGGGTGGGTQRKCCFLAPRPTPPPLLPVCGIARSFPRSLLLPRTASWSRSPALPTPDADSFSYVFVITAPKWLPVVRAHNAPPTQCQRRLALWLDTDSRYLARTRASFPIQSESQLTARLLRLPVILPLPLVGQEGVIASWAFQSRFRPTRSRSVLCARMPHWNYARARLPRPQLPRRRRRCFNLGVSLDAASESKGSKEWVHESPPFGFPMDGHVDLTSVLRARTRVHSLVLY